MPFKSEAQRRFMYSQHPAIAKRWAKDTSDGKLPAQASMRREASKQMLEKKGTAK